MCVYERDLKKKNPCHRNEVDLPGRGPTEGLILRSPAEANWSTFTMQLISLMKAPQNIC
jgi:hypothetical protein